MNPDWWIRRLLFHGRNTRRRGHRFQFSTLCINFLGKLLQLLAASHRYRRIRKRTKWNNSEESVASSLLPQTNENESRKKNAEGIISDRHGRSIFFFSAAFSPLGGLRAPRTGRRWISYASGKLLPPSMEETGRKCRRILRRGQERGGKERRAWLWLPSVPGESPREIAFPSRVHLANFASFHLNKPRPPRSCPPSTPVRTTPGPLRGGILFCGNLSRIVSVMDTLITIRQIIPAYLFSALSEGEVQNVGASEKAARQTKSRLEAFNPFSCNLSFTTRFLPCGRTWLIRLG